MTNHLVALAGSGGNHLRWLLLLDSKFTWQLQADRLIHRIHTDVNFLSNDLDAKVKFMHDIVYSTQRRYFNWLLYEHVFREHLDKHIVFSHEPPEGKNHKTLYLYMQPDAAIKNYLKFNFTLDSVSIEYFRYSQIKKHLLMQQQCPDALTLDAGILYNPVLDYDFYTKAIEYFELENHYDHASAIHNTWFLAQEQATQEFVHTFNNYFLNTK